MFEPFRCEDCVHGRHIEGTPFYECMYNYDMEMNEEQCEQNYEDDEEI